jgi:lipopolysaccharide transport system ATP-binding protein
MGISFRNVTSPPLAGFDATAPDGAVIGIIGENGSGQAKLREWAAGATTPDSGVVEGPASRRLLHAGEALNFAPVSLLLLDNALAGRDALVRARAAVSLDRMRRSGSTILLVSHEEDALRDLCDEVWWLDGGRLAGRGDPSEVLAAYRRHVAQRLREWGESVKAPLQPRMRRGDGRAEVTGIELLGESGRATTVWRSGELACVKVSVRFLAAVENPVIGMLIRSRIGLDVYGTNTELEGLKLGPVSPQESVCVTFAFRCELCPQQYTITAASHDADGVWHDWPEDAVAFSVTDTRYTAGVANLRATVTAERV